MKFDPGRHHRRSIRLEEYDYSQAGSYFITIVAQDRACVFGEVTDGEMVLSAAGQMLIAEWNVLPHRFPMIGLDAFIVMPNHVHGIIVINTNHESGRVGAGLVPAPSESPYDGAQADHGGATAFRATTRVAPTVVADVVGAFKSLTTVLYTHGVKELMWPAFGTRLWQRNYYEHIIRDDAALQRMREYVIANPIHWALDDENPT